MVVSVVADSGWTLSDCSRWENKELQEISRRAREKRRCADKLVKVWQRDGQETWVLEVRESRADYGGCSGCRVEIACKVYNRVLSLDKSHSNSPTVGHGNGGIGESL